MQITLRPSSGNSHPLGGLLIRGNTPKHWLLELQKLALPDDQIELYPLPGSVPNSVSGCFVLCKMSLKGFSQAPHELFQKVSGRLYVCENTSLYPLLSSIEIDKLFPEHIHVAHPGIGFVELKEPLDLSTCLIANPAIDATIQRPAPSVFIPSNISRFLIGQQDDEEVLKKLGGAVPSTSDDLNKDSLSMGEKIKLNLYKLFFNKKRTQEGTSTVPTGAFSFLEKMLSLFGKKPSGMMQDFEDLERRNQTAIDKLIDMLKKNPEEGLKYALPISDEGISRGNDSGFSLFDFSIRWFNFSLFDSNSSPKTYSGGGINIGDRSSNNLQQQYYQSARALEAEGKHQKAAFIYLKLLKDYGAAAQVLEKGGLYIEAATVYLKYVKNELKAAECYELGKVTEEAIHLYKKHKRHEKVGDLYYSIKQFNDGNKYYLEAIEELKQNSQYMRASLIGIDKMNSRELGMELLLSGWEQNKAEASGCLTKYLSYIPDSSMYKSEMQRVRISTSVMNYKNFATVLKGEYKVRQQESVWLREMAYDFVAQYMLKDPDVSRELEHFNKNDSEIINDVVRFKRGMR